MAFLDALSILAGGVAKGYRGSQELQRQIGEARRKALLEEREQQIREDIATAQIRVSKAAQLESEFELGEKKRTSTKGQQRIGTLLGGSVPESLTFESFKDFETLLRGRESDIAEENLYKRYPGLKGGRSRIPATPEERKMKYILDFSATPTILSLPEDEQDIAWDNYLNRVRALDPEAFGVKADTTRTNVPKLTETEKRRRYNERLKRKKSK